MTSVSPTTAARRGLLRRSTGARADGGPARRTWAVERDLVADAGALLALTAVALFGLHRVIDGAAWLAIGLVGAGVGAVAAWIIVVRRLSPAASLAVLLAAFVLGGGVACPDDAVAGFLPGPVLPGALLDALVHAWKQFVTTAPPVRAADGIGVIPYVLGFVPLSLGLVLARRTEQPAVPALPAVAALVAGIVLGTDEPASLLVQGSLFAAVALGWGAVRANRPRRSTDGIYWPRIVTGGLMLVAVTVLGTLLAGNLPFTGASRTVARQEIVPPFDPSSYASPLAAYRDYTVGRKDEVLFRGTDLPEGSRVRLAVMDRYDGVVWTVSGGDASGSGRFVRIGSRIPDPPAGSDAHPSFTVEGYHDVWIPTVGALVSARFGGPSADDLDRAFRYNSRTRSAASPLVLDEGDRIDLDVRDTPVPGAEALGEDQLDQVELPPLPDGEGIAEVLGKISEYTTDRLASLDQATGYALADSLATFLRDNGKFANGDGDDRPELRSTSGHSLMRLAAMVEAEELVGDGEQYTALLAVMLRQLGLPARVVVGFDTAEGGDVTLEGADLTAWVEVRFTDAGWVPFDATPDEDQKPDEPPKIQKEESDVTQQPPPPERYLEPPAEVQPITAKRSKAENAAREGGSGLAIPGFVLAALRWGGPPVGILAAAAGLVLGAKLLRRRRRRSRGDAAAQANGAWLEAIDLLRDAGLRPHPKATRRELATTGGAGELWHGGPHFAAAIDEAMFGPDDLDGAQVESLWSRLREEVEAIKAPMSTRRRLRVALSTASLRPHRARREPPPLASSVLLAPEVLPELVGAAAPAEAGGAAPYQERRR